MGKRLDEKRTNAFEPLVIKETGQLPAFYDSFANAKKITTFIYKHTNF